MATELPDRVLRRIILRFDAYLRRRQGVAEFTDDPGCMLRIGVARAPYRMELDGQTIEAGDPVLMLHLWNEHLPRMPQEGASLGSVRVLYSAFTASFRLLSLHIQASPELADLRAVGGPLALLAPGDHPGGVQFMQRLGFTVLPYRSPLGRFGEFWENFYSWWIIWTYNPGSLRGRPLGHLRRSELWMTMEEFMRRYGRATPA